MEIDHYAQAMSLHNKVEASLPFTVRPGKRFLRVPEQQGQQISAD